MLLLLSLSFSLGGGICEDRLAAAFLLHILKVTERIRKGKKETKGEMRCLNMKKAKGWKSAVITPVFLLSLQPLYTDQSNCSETPGHLLLNTHTQTHSGPAR